MEMEKKKKEEKKKEEEEEEEEKKKEEEKEEEEEQPPEEEPIKEGLADAAKQRITEAKESERRLNNFDPDQPDNVIFPSSSVFVIDDFQIVAEEAEQQPFSGAGKKKSNENNQKNEGAFSTASRFKQETLATFRVLAQLFSSLSNHFFLHCIAIAHSQNLSGTTGSHLGQLGRLVRNSVRSYTIFLGLSNREKRSLLLNHVSGGDFDLMKDVILAASKQRNENDDDDEDGDNNGGNEGEKDIGNVQTHPALTFEFPNPTNAAATRFINFREENSFGPFSFLSHSFLDNSAKRRNNNNNSDVRQQQRLEKDCLI